MPDEEAERLIEAGDDEAAARRLGEVLGGGGLTAEEAAGLRLRRATCWYRLGRLGEALEDARKVAELPYPPHREDAAFLAAAILRRRKRWREAAEAYDRAAESASTETRRRVARLMASLCREEDGDWDGAEAGYRMLLAAGEDAEAAYRLGLAAERKGDVAAARAAFEKALSWVGEDDAPASARAEGEVEGRLAARNAAPLSAQIHFRLALLDRAAGRLEAAAQHLDAAARKAEGTFLGDACRRTAEKLRAEWGVAKRGFRAYDPAS